MHCTKFSWEPPASFQGQCHGGEDSLLKYALLLQLLCPAVQPKVAIIAGTRLIFHFLAVYLLLCFPLLHNSVAAQMGPGRIKQLEADVDMSSPPLIMGEMGQG